MNHQSLHRILFAVLAMLLAFPSPGRAQPPAQAHSMVVLIVHPLVEIYEGDTITLPYVVDDPSANGDLLLAPLTPDEAEVSASLGSASVSPEGLGGTITYTAGKAGQESILLTVSNYFGTVTGSIEFEVKPRPNYSVKFLVVTTDKDSAGGGFFSLFTGEGDFTNVDSAPIQGKGNSDMWFLLWVSNNAFACVLNPVVQGASSFEISGLTGPAPLVPMPGSSDPFTLDLKFQPMSTNASKISCEGLGGFTASFDWPAVEGDLNSVPLHNLFFLDDSTMIPIKANKTWGYVWVERK